MLRGLLIACFGFLLLAARASGTAPHREDARAFFERRNGCLEELEREPERAMKNPACQDLPEIRARQKHVRDDRVVKSSLQFCPENGTNESPCPCDSNGIDARCTFRICGYDRGYFSDASLFAFAREVASVLAKWQNKRLLWKRFVGFADGTEWGESKKPKPERRSGWVESCFAKAKTAAADSIRGFDEADRLDAELAILRGCALEEALDESMQGFEFDAWPTFSFNDRVVGVENARIRAAEVELLIVDGCEELR